MTISIRDIDNQTMDKLMNLVRAVDDAPERVFIRLLENLTFKEALELLNEEKDRGKALRKEGTEKSP